MLAIVEVVIETLKNPEARTRTRRLALLLFLLAEVCIISWFWHRGPARKAVRAFLARQGNHFVLAWKDDLNEINVEHRHSLDELIRFSSVELGLRLGRNPGIKYTIESVWMTDRAGTYIVFWKNESDNLLNQMTFYSLGEAIFFAQAFRSGSYSQSILGHSVLLVGNSQ